MNAFAVHCIYNCQNFRGSSQLAWNLLCITGYGGMFLYFVLFVWAFFPFAWWQPILTIPGTIVLGAITQSFCRENLVGMMLNPYLVIICAIVSIVGLIVA